MTAPELTRREATMPWAASLAVHGGMALLVFLLPPPAPPDRELAPIELTDRQLPEKPPEPPKAEEKKGPEPTPAATLAAVKRPVRPPPREPPPETPPQEPPPPPQDTGPQTFGIQLEGTTTAPAGEGVQVPVGDSLAVSPKIRKRGPKPPEKRAESGFKPTYKRGEQAPVAVITRRPNVIKRVLAEYPEKARELGIEGRVVLELTISAEGKVVAVKLVRKLHDLLDQAAIRAAWQMRFGPALVNGTAVTVRIPYTFTFVLD